MAKRWVADRFGGPDVLRLVEAEVPAPEPGTVTIAVRAAGVNPADLNALSGARNPDPSLLPLWPGFEVAGVVTAVGVGTRIASGPVGVGDEVIAFRITGGYSSAVTVPAADVFAKPATLPFPEAANLLLAGTTAAEMLHLAGVGRGQSVLVHGASGAVGISLVQQAVRLGARVIGTAGASRADVVERFGGLATLYGPGLEGRVRALAPAGLDAALDAVGSDEAIDVSLALLPDRSQLITAVALQRASREGFRSVQGQWPASAAFRDSVRETLISLAGRRELTVPIARTFPLEQAPHALQLLGSGHPGGKIALRP